MNFIVKTVSRSKHFTKLLATSPALSINITLLELQLKLQNTFFVLLKSFKFHLVLESLILLVLLENHSRWATTLMQLKFPFGKWLLIKTTDHAKGEFGKQLLKFTQSTKDESQLHLKDFAWETQMWFLSWLTGGIFFLMCKEEVQKLSF